MKSPPKALSDVRQWREEVTLELANQTVDERNRRAREFAERLGLRVLQLSDLARPEPNADPRVG